MYFENLFLTRWHVGTLRESQGILKEWQDQEIELQVIFGTLIVCELEQVIPSLWAVSQFLFCKMTISVIELENVNLRNDFRTHHQRKRSRFHMLLNYSWASAVMQVYPTQSRMSFENLSSHEI